MEPDTSVRVLLDVTEYHQDATIVLHEAKCLLVGVGVARPVLGGSLKMNALCAFETYAALHYAQSVITVNITALILITLEIAGMFVNSVA